MSFLNKFFAKKEEIISSTGVFRLIQKYSATRKDVHVFVEDEDDCEFYRVPLNRIYDGYDIIPYFQKGKKNVFDAYNEIDWTRFKKERVLFFVDKDFDDILNKNSISEDNFFVTKYYSIENYLVTPEVFTVILKRVYGMSEETLIQTFLDEIQKAQSRFHSYMMPIISLILIYRTESEHIDLDKINLSELYYFEDFKINKKRILSVEQYNTIVTNPLSTKSERVSIRIEKTLEHILTRCVKDTNVYSFSKLKENRKKIETIESKKTFIRGKYEFWFLLEILKNIEVQTKKINDKIRNLNLSVENEGDKKPLYKRRMEINARNIFDLFPPKIKTPEDIEEFLKLNYSRL